MIEHPDECLKNEKLFTKKDQLLLAFSGGIDSVVLAHLLHTDGYKFGLAHCNFGLRGKESDEDEKFCAAFAKKIKVPFFSQRFDTESFAQKNRLSIQMAARKLRYDWFAELLKKSSYDLIVTAHQANDVMETTLINLIRGTGINGITGIPAVQQKIRRPLLSCSKESIVAYAQQNKLKYRHDSSNDEIKYKRNFLRHTVIPALKGLNPSLEKTFLQNTRLFGQAAAIVNTYIGEKRNRLLSSAKDKSVIDLVQLKKEDHTELLLHELMKPFGFNPSQTQAMHRSITEKFLPGKLFISPAHQALIDRREIIITPIGHTEEDHEYVAADAKELEHLPVHITYAITDQRDFPKDNNSLLVDADQLKFPVTIRKWRSGDRFRPLGMRGFKKLSDFFTAQKLSRFEKQNVWLLLSGNEIAWVIGYRLDDRFRITERTRRVAELKFIP